MNIFCKIFGHKESLPQPVSKQGNHDVIICERCNRIVRVILNYPSRDSITRNSYDPHPP